MKREGRQHGMVRTHCILPSAGVIFPKKTNSIVDGPPPTAGIFTRVSSKPTNHSKFTGKCRRVGCFSCHLHPCSKSKDKTKGSSKTSLKLDGFSSSDVLELQLDELHDYNHVLNHGYCEEEDEDDEVECNDNGCDDTDEKETQSTIHQSEEDDIMGGYFDVEYAWEPLDAEQGWSLIGEIRSINAI